MNNFLPEGYKEPVTDKFMKLKDGENTLRVLSSAVVGNLFWKTEINADGAESRKPVRRRMNEPIFPDELGTDKWGNPESPKHFWAFAVYNVDADAIQIYEITQKCIQRSIKALVENKKWGDPKEYNISITKSGDGLDTEYQIMAEPKEKLDDEVIKRYQEMNVNLDAMFEGKDPFAQEREESQEVDIEEVPIK